VSEPTVKDLLERIAGMEDAIDALTQTLEKQIKANAGYNKHHSRIQKLIQNDLSDAFERIKNIELKFFPHLADDIRRLYEMVPDDDKAWNPLDYRKP
jgi:hypothetical protein